MLLGGCLLAGCSPARRNAKQQLLPASDSVLQQSAAQYKMLLRGLPAGKLPRNWDPKTGQLTTSGSGWWCSGFYPGTLLCLFEATKDSALYREAVRVLPLLEKEQYNTSTHDLGFMMYCSYGNALRIDPKPEYRSVLLQSARSLATRFNAKVGAIRSWNAKPGEFLVIIDNMMNLELLFWASRESGDPSFRNIALKHAETTLANHFRPDYSSYHVVNYDSATGAVLQKRTAQGYADASAWARGQAWGLYGYTLMYRETRDPRFMEQAQGIAGFLLEHPRLPADKIPFWDFDPPGIPDAPRDASAAAIIASALLELQGYSDAKMSKRYTAAATTILHTLMSAGYRATPGTNGGFLLRHSVGHLPAGSEVDVALTYADYYFVEALLRYRALNAARN
ncbi:glucuronyl hydrolase [Flaviaesturariibacter flavus]|uniref:Glucuronyl hydrolase n=2 Tax=Flaviaesturariibacter flavus TaxID=2502780 RepID=A0A4R1BKN9_9BACT|nr:glucuronyl hydrolase [Flaviaesturariibacter flavus]